MAQFLAHYQGILCATACICGPSASESEAGLRWMDFGLVLGSAGTREESPDSPSYLLRWHLCLRCPLNQYPFRHLLLPLRLSSVITDDTQMFLGGPILGVGNRMWNKAEKFPLPTKFLFLKRGARQLTSKINTPIQDHK